MIKETKTMIKLITTTSVTTLATAATTLAMTTTTKTTIITKMMTKTPTSDDVNNNNNRSNSTYANDNADNDDSWTPCKIQHCKKLAKLIARMKTHFLRLFRQTI